METNENNFQLNERLRKMLAAIGQNTTQICRKAGVNQSNVSAMLRNKRAATFEALVRISRVFPEINPLYAMQGEGHEVRTQDEDFMPLACKRSAFVLVEITSRYGVSIGQLSQNVCLEDLREVADEKRNFSMMELQTLHDLFPELNVFWLITYSGPMRDAGYAKLRMKIRD